MLLLAQTSLIAHYGIRFHVYLFSQASICLAWWFQHDCVEERAHLGLVSERVRQLLFDPLARYHLTQLSDRCIPATMLRLFV